MIVFLFKTLVRGIFLLAMLPLLVALLLTSESVNRWLFEQAQRFEPRLQIETVSGQFWKGWQLSGVSWEDDNLSAEVDSLELGWSANCLFGLRLCIDQLAIGNVVLDISPGEEASEPRPERIDLPTVDLPLSIQIDQLSLASLRLNSDDALLQNVQLMVSARGDVVQVHHFSGSAMDIGWQLNAELQTSGDWPVMLRSDVRLPDIDNQPMTAAIRLDGSLAELDVDVRTRGYVPGRLQGQVSPLQASLPLDMRWQGDRFLALSELPASLTMEQWALKIAGNLDEGFAVTGDADFPGQGEGDAVRAEWQTRVTLERAEELQLRLYAAEDPERQLTLTGNADWSGSEPRADVQLKLRDFPWQRLYPQDLGDISLHALDMNAEVVGMAVQGDLAADLRGVANQEVSLSLRADASPEHAAIRDLLVTTPAGVATGKVDLQLQPALNWQAELLLDGIDPGVFVAQLPGQLSGPLTSQGSFEQTLALQANWALEGQLRSQPLSLSGTVDLDDGAWEVPEFELVQGQNRINAQGYWRDQVSAAINLELPDMHTLWTGLSGEMAGEVTLSGPADAVEVVSNLNARRLGYNDVHLVGLELESALTLSDELPMQLDLSASHLRQADTRIGNLALSLQGNKASHELNLGVDRGPLDVDLLVSGGLDDNAWRGRIARGELASEEMIWTLQDSAALDYQLASGSLTLGQHCWQQDRAALCFDGEQALLPEQRIDLTLRDFALASLQHLMPDDIDWNATLNADIAFTQRSGQQPVAEVDVRSQGGVITLQNPEQSLEFAYDEISLRGDLMAEQANTRIRIISEGIGELLVDAEIADPVGAQTLSGRYEVRGLRLDILRPFLPQVESLRGQINGSGELAGTLTEADISGNLVLADGHVSGRELPINMDDLHVDIRIDGQRADIDGRWRSGSEGQATLDGHVAWAPELDLLLTLKGADLPVVIDPYADLRVSPDLRVELADNRLDVTGQIAVPDGDIVVRELPEQAVRQSSDVVIVGVDDAEEEEGPLPLDINATVRLLIGDQLRFEGFGLTGRLSGQLQVQENLNATGDLNILDGRYRGYGQRLNLRRAQILFAGPISQPFLNIEAIRKVDDVTAGLRLTGRADAPQSEVFSEPAMAQEQALSYLILGRPLGGDGNGDNNMLGQAALALGMAGSAPLAQNIAGTLGIDNFQIETEGSGLTTQVVAAGYLTERLSLRYGVGVFEPANQIALRYDLTKRLYLEAVGGLANSLDFFYRIDFGDTE
ncbi:translocation/assembly module TamB domain-containing protein [Halopseudomonas salegens]|uniref:Translocation and assembly module TamB n=1 Tax=Halopseudomonas salegens TaxID=1434072 RepID=A0A1H2F6K9_9GAMM|nr:translocation/assembly module TamB domain-containing protein [Halopseudomonas salegens]SDU02991.1 translocation and assembly module TamB [Halopseudomonas salegens]